MVFKVISSAEAKEIGQWDVEHTVTGEIVAQIKTGWSWANSNKKELFVKDKKIDDVKNQKEALLKLERFFSENERDIEMYRKIHEDLTKDIKQVTSDHAVDVLFKEVQRLESVIGKLEEYSLK